MRIKRLFFVSLGGLVASVVSPPHRATRGPRFQILPAKAGQKPANSSLCKVKKIIKILLATSSRCEII
jgi:hypothetical protein